MAKKNEPRRAITLGSSALDVASDVREQELVPGFGYTARGVLVVHGTPSFEKCEAVAERLSTLEKAGPQFLIGDFLIYVEDKYGERAAQIVDSDKGWSERTLAVYRWIASRIAPERRRMDRLKIMHHQLVASLPPSQQEKWLTKAAADEDPEPWTVARLKKALDAGEDVPPTKWWVVVSASGEKDADALMERMIAEGRSAKVTQRRERKKEESK